MAETELTYTWA